MLIPILQIITAVLIVALILLQERSSGMSGLLGGGDAGSFYHARRGVEKIIFYGTVALVALFVALAVVGLIY